jgi:hypothetical protein
MPLAQTLRLTQCSLVRSWLGTLGVDGACVGLSAVNRPSGDTHLQGLMRPGGVVMVHPLVECLLGNLDTSENCALTEEFNSQAPMEPFDLARRGRRATNAARNPSHTARVRSRAITRAQTTSICHNFIAAARSHRFHFRERRSRRFGSTICARTNARYAADSKGSGATCRLANSNTNRFGPQYGRERRSSVNAASTLAGI